LFFILAKLQFSFSNNGETAKSKILANSPPDLASQDGTGMGGFDLFAGTPIIIPPLR
jgi:hypothetical protein